MRYMNPGFKDWDMVIGASSSLTETTDTTKTKTGIAFRNTDRRNYLLFDYPASGEFFCRFDFFYPTRDGGYFYFGEHSSGSEPYNGVAFAISSDTLRFLRFVKGQWAQVFDYTGVIELGLKYGGINSVLFHLKWADSENGFIDLTVNDYSFDRIESADFIPYDNSKVKFTFRDTTTAIQVSNVIISDEPISIKEQIVALPISGVETDMTSDSETGIYTASAVNQSLLASVNVADLISNYGSDSKVTGVAVVGNPAYRTAEGLSSFTALTKKNNNVTEYGAANIPAESSVVANSFSIASDTSVADLQNMQIGLKVGG